jgi:MFS family permease
VTTGGGLGLLSFAPLSQRVGRRPAFLLFHLFGFLLVGLLFLLSHSLYALLPLLPVFGFFTLGMHAGYAIYFPELYPTRLRSTGAGFCFNVARVLAAPVLLIFGWLQGDPLKLTRPEAILTLGSLFLVGAVLVLFAPETRGQPLPD